MKNGINCPMCGYDQTAVTNTRYWSEIQSVVRRRECQGCGQRFNTVETLPGDSLKKALLREVNKTRREAAQACETINRVMDRLTQMIEFADEEKHLKD